MNINHELCGKIAGVLATIGFIPYAVAILRKNDPIVPSKASWIIWTVVGSVVALSYKASGASSTLWVPISYAVCPILILLATFYKNREKEKWPRVDKVCLGIGITLFIPWASFKLIQRFNIVPSWGWILPLISLYGGITVDAFGAIPTVVKAWKDPKSEDFWGWTFYVLGGIVNLFAIEDWSWNVAAYPIYVLTPAFILWPSLFIYRLKKCKLSSSTAPVSHK